MNKFLLVFLIGLSPTLTHADEKYIKLEGFASGPLERTLSVNAIDSGAGYYSWKEMSFWIQDPPELKGKRLEFFWDQNPEQNHPIFNDKNYLELRVPESFIWELTPQKELTEALGGPTLWGIKEVIVKSYEGEKLFP